MREHLFLILTLGLLWSGAYAATKEDAARDLLLKSYNQADIWREPVQLVAKVKLPRPKGQDINLQYKVWWTGPDKWRAEWSGANYSRVIVVNDGKQYRFSSAAVPPLPVLQFERALGALTGGGIGGYFPAPRDIRVDKLRVRSDKIDKMPVECISFSGWTSTDLCIDTSSARVLSLLAAPGSFEYGDYASLGPAEFPQTVRFVVERVVQVDATLNFTRLANTDDALFAPPANSAVSDLPSCGDKKQSIPPYIDKKVQPSYPENARLARHQGTVWLYALVRNDGSIESLKLLSSSWPELEKSAMEAVQQWKYTPYLHCGQAVEYETIISVNYSLSQ